MKGEEREWVQVEFRREELDLAAELHTAAAAGAASRRGWGGMWKRRREVRMGEHHGAGVRSFFSTRMDAVIHSSTVFRKIIR